MIRGCVEYVDTEWEKQEQKKQKTKHTHKENTDINILIKSC